MSHELSMRLRINTTASLSNIYGSNNISYHSEDKNTQALEVVVG